MTDHDSKPTPPSGMPAAVAATPVAKPSVDDAGSAPADSTVAILTAFEALRADVTTQVSRIESKTDAQGTALKHLTNEVASHGKQISDLAQAQVSTAKAAAAAAEIAAQSLAKANTSQDENAKMVQSAMLIQKDTIAAAVTTAVAPIASKVEGLERNDADQAKTLDAQNVELAALKKSGEKTETTLGQHTEQIGDVKTSVDNVKKSVDGVVTSIGTIASGVAKLARWQDHWAFKVLLAIAVFAGGFYAAMRAATPAAAPTQTTTIISPAAAPPALPAATTTSPSH